VSKKRKKRASRLRPQSGASQGSKFNILLGSFAKASGCRNGCRPKSQISGERQTAATPGPASAQDKTQGPPLEREAPASPFGHLAREPARPKQSGHGKKKIG
jgi:hypothetical protein